MAQWFRRWTVERATRGSIPALSVTHQMTTMHHRMRFLVTKFCYSNTLFHIDAADGLTSESQAIGRLNMLPVLMVARLGHVRVAESDVSTV